MDKVRIFISYANEDKAFLDQLLKHLSSLVSEGLIEPWTDRGLQAGDRWDEEIRAELETAKVILLLVSANFLASKYIASVELARALEREKRRETVVIPVILRFADWHSTPFHYLQALPDKGKPVTDWRNRDEAYLNITTGLRRVIAQLHTAQSASRPASTEIEATAEPKTVQQDRVLDAAMAAKIPLGKPSDLTVMVRKADSAGLKAVLAGDDEFTAAPEDVKSKPFQMEFSRDASGKCKPERLTIKIEAPDFDPPAQSDEIVVPPDRDSGVCTFLLRPLYPGELVVKLKVFAQDGTTAMRLMRIISEASDRVIEGGRVIASIPITTVAGAQAAPRPALEPGEFARMFEAPVAAPPLASEAAPRASKTGEYTRMFGGPPAPQAPASPVPAAASSLPPPQSMPMPAQPSVRPDMAPKKKRRWVLPAASAAAAVVLVGTAVVQLGPVATSPNPSTASAPMALQVPVKPPAAPQITTAVASRSPASVASGGNSGAAGSSGNPTWLAEYRTGISAANAGDYAAARRNFQQAVKKAPNEAAPKYALATASLHMADTAAGKMRAAYLDDAIANASQAAELSPNSAQALYVKGLALEKSGQFADAEQSLQRAAKLNPHDSNTWYALGLALEKQNRTQEAVAALNKAVAIDPANTNARLLLAAALAAQNPAAAEKHIVLLKNDTSLSPAERVALNQIQTAVAAKRKTTKNPQ